MSKQVTGADVRAMREARGMTQKDLAAALGMGAHGWQTVSAWENGREIPANFQAAVRLLEGAK